MNETKAKSQRENKELYILHFTINCAIMIEIGLNQNNGTITSNLFIFSEHFSFFLSRSSLLVFHIFFLEFHYTKTLKTQQQQQLRPANQFMQA